MEFSSVFFHAAKSPAMRSLFGASCARCEPASDVIESGESSLLMPSIPLVSCGCKRHEPQPNFLRNGIRCFAPAEFSTLHAKIYSIIMLPTTPRRKLRRWSSLQLIL